MAISASIIPSFTAPRSRGIFSSAKNFITGRKPGLESIIENISSPQKSTSNFLTVFGSEDTEKILKKNVITLRDTLLDVFDLSRVLVVAIDEISKSLKNLSVNARRSGGGRGLLGNLLTGGALVGGGSVVGNKLTKKVTQEGAERTTTKLGSRLLQKTTTSQATKGVVPKLTNFAKKNKWLALLGLLGLPLLPWLSGGDANAGSIDSGSINRFSSNIDIFAKAVESLKQINSNSVANEKNKNVTSSWTNVEPGSEEEKKLIDEGVKSLNESSKKHLELNSQVNQNLILKGEVKKDEKGNWVFVDKPTIIGESNNNLKQIDNLSVGNNKPIFNVIPYSGMPTQTDNGSGKNLNIPTSSGASPDMPFLSSSKSDNFVVLQSKMIYNIVE